MTLKIPIFIARKLRHTVLMCLFTGLFPNGYNLSQHRLCEDVCKIYMVEMALN